MFAPVKVRKSIPRTIFGLTLVTKKIFQKILLDLPCPSPRRLQIPFHRCPALCRRISALRHQKVSQRAFGLTRRPSSLAKVGCMALTSLSESSRADTDFSQKVVGYRMHKTCSRSINLLSLMNTKAPRLSLVF